MAAFSSPCGRCSVLSSVSGCAVAARAAGCAVLAAGGLVVRGAAVAGVAAPVGVSCSPRRLLRGALLARRRPWPLVGAPCPVASCPPGSAVAARSACSALVLSAPAALASPTLLLPPCSSPRLVRPPRRPVRRRRFARFLAAWRCRPGFRLSPLRWPLVPGSLPLLGLLPLVAPPAARRRAVRSGALAPAVRRARAPGAAAGCRVGSRVRARLGARPALGLSCSPFFCCLLGGVLWSLSRLAPPLSSLSRVGRCPRCWCALVALARLGCWSPASSRCRRPRLLPAAPPSGRVAPWRSALALVARLANGRCRARCPGRRRVAPLARVACCRSRVGCAASPKRWTAPACLMCNSAVRCPACPPSSPAGAPVPLVRCAPVARWFAPCPLCGAVGLVLVTSGAARPFLWCAWCGLAAPAPARSRWSSSREPSQLSLF